MTIGVFTAPLGCEQYQLDYVGLWARGFANEQDFVVCAGSEVRIGINPSVNPILVTRRRVLAEAGALEAIRGLEDRQRLATAVAFPSAAIAAKVVTGAHVNAGTGRGSARPARGDVMRASAMLLSDSNNVPSRSSRRRSVESLCRTQSQRLRTNVTPPVLQVVMRMRIPDAAGWSWVPTGHAAPCCGRRA